MNLRSNNEILVFHFDYYFRFVVKGLKASWHKGQGHERLLRSCKEISVIQTCDYLAANYVGQKFLDNRVSSFNCPFCRFKKVLPCLAIKSTSSLSL